MDGRIPTDGWGMPMYQPPPRQEAAPVAPAGPAAPTVIYLQQPAPQAVAATTQDPHFLMNLALVLLAAVVALAFMAGSAQAQLDSVRRLAESNHNLLARALALPQATAATLPPRTIVPQ